MTLSEFAAAIAALPYGKQLPTARYVFAPDESALPEPLASFIGKLRGRLGLSGEFNILKLAPADFAISFLRYPGFLTEAHPALMEAVRIHLAAGTVKRTDFSTLSNPRNQPAGPVPMNCPSPSAKPSSPLVFLFPGNQQTSCSLLTLHLVHDLFRGVTK